MFIDPPKFTLVKTVEDLPNAEFFFTEKPVGTDLIVSIIPGSKPLFYNKAGGKFTSALWPAIESQLTRKLSKIDIFCNLFAQYIEGDDAVWDLLIYAVYDRNQRKMLSISRFNELKDKSYGANFLFSEWRQVTNITRDCTFPAPGREISPLFSGEGYYLNSGTRFWFFKDPLYNLKTTDPEAYSSHADLRRLDILTEGNLFKYLGVSGTDTEPEKGRTMKMHRIINEYCSDKADLRDLIDRLRKRCLTVSFERNQK